MAVGLWEGFCFELEVTVYLHNDVKDTEEK